MSSFQQYLRDHHGAMLAVAVLLQNMKVFDSHIMQGLSAFVSTLAG